ncbi:hypothetical protein PMIN06_003226 [Paraphaeosphaeria minitans]
MVEAGKKLRQVGMIRWMMALGARREQQRLRCRRVSKQRKMRRVSGNVREEAGGTFRPLIGRWVALPMHINNLCCPIHASLASGQRNRPTPSPMPRRRRLHLFYTSCCLIGSRVQRRPSVVHERQVCPQG